MYLNVKRCRKVLAVFLGMCLVLSGCSKKTEETTNDISSVKLKSNQEIVAFMFIYKECMCMKNKVKELRTKSKITQQQLADMVHVSSRTIISIEKEQYNPSLMLAYRIAQVFNVSVEELCCLKENKELEDRQYEDI